MRAGEARVHHAPSLTQVGRKVHVKGEKVTTAKYRATALSWPSLNAFSVHFFRFAGAPYCCWLCLVHGKSICGDVPSKEEFRVNKFDE